MNHNTITATDFVALFTRQTPSILDVRTTAEHATEKLESSILLPVQDLSVASFRQCETQLSSAEQSIYILCESGKRAEMACAKLAEIDKPFVIIEGGLKALKAAGIKTQVSQRKSISLERQVRISAGMLVVLGGLLGFMVSPTFFALSIFVGAGLVFAGISDTCAMGMLLARMPWNQK